MFSSFTYLSPLVEAYEKMRIDSRTNTFRSASTTPTPQQQKRYSDTDDGYEPLSNEDREYYSREIERLKKLQQRYREMAKNQNRNSAGIGFAETAIGNTIQRYQDKIKASEQKSHDSTQNDGVPAQNSAQNTAQNVDADNTEQAST